MPALKNLAAALVLLGLLAARQAAAEPCNTTFFDAISGADSDTGLFEQGLSLAGAKDKLPDPNALPVTILVPNNKAWFDLMFKNGFFLRQISDLGPMLTGLMTYHILPQPLSPDQLKTEGKAQTLYGLLTGQDMPLTHYAKFDDGQLLFMGRPDGEEIAGVVETIQVCNSWVYIVDEVLKPTVDLSDVAQVDLSTISSIGGISSGGSASPQPSPTPSPEASPSPPADGSGGSTEAPATGACDKTFAQVAGETPGLSILKTVVSQSQFSSALPDPSGNYTLFAPTDTAFFSLLTTYNLSITDALALGDRLTSVLLYHVAVGALTPEQLAKETSLTTGLALKTQDSQYTIGVSTADGKTSVSGRAPGNTAAIQQNLAVCGSQVYVIDKVLVPSAALDAIPATSGGLIAAASAPASPTASPSPAPAAEPSPSPAPVPSPSPAPEPSPSPAPVPSPSPAPVPSTPSPAPAPQPEQPSGGAGSGANSLSGVALGTGYLAGCEVQLVQGGEALKKATTDSSGRFSFDCGADCTTLGASLKLPAAGQQAGCADSLTKLPPPFDVLAPVSALPLGVDQPRALSPLTTIIATASQPAVSVSSLPAIPAPAPAPSNRKLLQGGSAPAPQPAAAGNGSTGIVAGSGKLNPDFAIAEESNSSSSMVSTEYGDLVKAALGGDLMAYKLLSSNQELVCTGSVSGALLSALAGGEGTSPAQASQALFNQLAKDLLAGSPFNLTDAASVQGLLGRALAELTSGGGSTPAGVDAQAVQSAAAGTLTLVNSLLEQAVTTAESSQLKDGADKMVEVLARLAKVCQASIAPAAAQLGKGQLSVEAWQQQFSLDSVRDLAVAAQL